MIIQPRQKQGISFRSTSVSTSLYWDASSLFFPASLCLCSEKKLTSTRTVYSGTLSKDHRTSDITWITSDHEVFIGFLTLWRGRPMLSLCAVCSISLKMMCCSLQQRSFPRLPLRVTRFIRILIVQFSDAPTPAKAAHEVGTSYMIGTTIQDS